MQPAQSLHVTSLDILVELRTTNVDTYDSVRFRVRLRLQLDARHLKLVNHEGCFFLTVTVSAVRVFQESKTLLVERAKSEEVYARLGLSADTIEQTTPRIQIIHRNDAVHHLCLWGLMSLQEYSINTFDQRAAKLSMPGQMFS